VMVRGSVVRRLVDFIASLDGEEGTVHHQVTLPASRGVRAAPTPPNAWFRERLIAFGRR